MTSFYIFSLVILKTKKIEFKSLNKFHLKSPLIAFIRSHFNTMTSFKRLSLSLSRYLQEFADCQSQLQVGDAVLTSAATGLFPIHYLITKDHMGHCIESNSTVGAVEKLKASFKKRNGNGQHTLYSLTTSGLGEPIAL
jgi:hypothetical protein